MSRAMNALVMLLKLAVMCVLVEILMMLLMKTVKVKARHVKTVESTLEIERRTSGEMTASSAAGRKQIGVIIKEATRTENIIKIGSVGGTVK